MIDEIKIMQYVDGTLPAEEKETVEKAIESNPEFKKLLKDYQETADALFNLGKSIKSQPLPNSLKKKLKEFNALKESHLKKDKPGFFKAIFQKPIRNFIAYPITSVFIFTFGFQVNNYSTKIAIERETNLPQSNRNLEYIQSLEAEERPLQTKNLQQSYGSLEAETPLYAKKRTQWKYFKDTPEEMIVLIRELEELRKQIEALQAEIIDLKIKFHLPE